VSIDKVEREDGDRTGVLRPEQFYGLGRERRFTESPGVMSDDYQIAYDINLIVYIHLMLVCDVSCRVFCSLSSPFKGSMPLCESISQGMEGPCPDFRAFVGLLENSAYLLEMP
jgi:hypothetical protein